MISSGKLFERKLSLDIHAHKTPVLISSKMLRQFGCGQVDLAYLDRGKVVLVEAKSSSIGVQSMKVAQWKRLTRSASLIESLIGIPVCVKFIAKRFSGL